MAAKQRKLWPRDGSASSTGESLQGGTVEWKRDRK